jgi:hypothetical protein
MQKKEIRIRAVKVCRRGIVPMPKSVINLRERVCNKSLRDL